MVAIWQVEGGWHALGAFGVGLFTICQFAGAHVADEPG